MMTKSNELLQKLQAFDPVELPEADYEKQSKHITNYISQLSPEKLVSGTSDGEDFLDVSGNLYCSSSSQSSELSTSIDTFATSFSIPVYRQFPTSSS